MSCAPVKCSRFCLSIQHLWILVVLGGIFVFVNTHPIRPHDYWWHIAVGREILTTGQIPAVDIYSYTASGAPYPSYRMFWLMEIALYSIYHLGGAALVVFTQSLVVTGAYLFLFLTGLRLTQDWRVSALGVLFAAALGMNDWNVRPQTITFLIGAVFVFLIHYIRSGGKRGWAAAFPLGMLLWVNSHGSFALGLLLIGLWLSQELWEVWVARRTGSLHAGKGYLKVAGAAFLATLGACLVNPSGLGIIQYLTTLGGNPVVQKLVVEWAPPTFDTLAGGLFFAGLLLTALILVVSPHRPTIFQLGCFISLAAISLKTSRGIIWFGLVMAPVLAEHSLALLSSLRKRASPSGGYRGSPMVNWLLAGSLAALALITLPWFKSWLPLPPAKAGLISAETPVEATRALLEIQPAGEVFHAMSFGSYLIWQAQPEYRVFVDGRIELYPEGVWLDYLQISNAQGDWAARLENYGVHTLMLSRREQPALVTAVLNDPRWELAYEDAAALIFTER